jgi:transcription-repair coupling factor (superfamily II helicase)
VNALSSIIQALETSNRVVVPHVSGPIRAHLSVEVRQADWLPILITDSVEDAEKVLSDLAFLLGAKDGDLSEKGFFLLSHDEQSPYEDYSPDARSTMERIQCLYKLLREPETVRGLVVTPSALFRRHVPPAYFDANSEYLVVGEEINRDHLLRRLQQTGYNRVSKVEDPGTFSVRGGIIDIFGPHRNQPIRLDLFGEVIDNIKLFDPSTQRVVGDLEDAILLPARELSFSAEVKTKALEKIDALTQETLIPSRSLRAIREDIENELHFFGIESLLPIFHHALVPLDVYLPKHARAVVLCDDPAHLAEYGYELLEEAENSRARAVASHRLAVPVESHLVDGDEGRAPVERSKRILWPEVALEEPTVTLRHESTHTLRTDILAATRSHEGDDVLKPLVDRLKTLRADGYTTILACNTRGQLERLSKLLEQKNVQIRRLQKPFSLPWLLESASPSDARYAGQATLRDRSIHAWLTLGDVSRGYVLPDRRLAIISEEDIFGQRVRSKRKRTPEARDFLSDLRDLAVGDYVVHMDFGIGQYAGLKKLAVGGVESDFLTLEYRDQDKLYLPVHQIRLISKYAGAGEDRKPVLAKLGGPAWTNTKQKVKDTLLKMAAELLRLYAARATLDGFALPAPDETYRQFEAEFAFEPTPDQARTIKEVLDDLQKPSPMDRVVCGDVGYGKTEVAMRATMHAVLGGKQVAVLVPTTVLAAQHGAVFKERFKNFGVRIAIISRFQSKEEIKKALQDMKEGQVDIVIGTHRLLSKDIHFKQLGLIVIDEEHRFGVKHKEELKKYRATVHVLSMSATPIPRTMHMGFMGVRDMSLIGTAPVDRLAVKTEVHRFSEDILRDAIVKELHRGGQCFVVHNRVASIAALAKFIERIVPEARVVVGHGQMAEDRLERVMVDFMNREYNVLVSTTIVESGIDIPNANTILINRADQMGLAQLYQLKGRVGRGKQRGFAYFLIPAGNLTPKARQRISVLQRFTELGAGYKVASRDLEIRGAGNLLGKQQSGTIAQVGFDMYQALLAEAIAELKGAGAHAWREAEIQLPLTALLPESFIPEPGERLAYYQRLSRADTDEKTYDLLQELSEIYGTPPAEVENLVEVMRIKQRLHRIGAIAMDYAPKTKSMESRIIVRFDAENPGVAPEDLVTFVKAAPRKRKVTPDGKLVFEIGPFEDVREIAHQARDRLEELIRLHRA